MPRQVRGIFFSGFGAKEIDFRRTQSSKNPGRPQVACRESHATCRAAAAAFPDHDPWMKPRRALMCLQWLSWRPFRGFRVAFSVPDSAEVRSSPAATGAARVPVSANAPGWERSFHGAARRCVSRAFRNAKCDRSRCRKWMHEHGFRPARRDAGALDDAAGDTRHLAVDRFAEGQYQSVGRDAAHAAADRG